MEKEIDSICGSKNKDDSVIDACVKIIVIFLLAAVPIALILGAAIRVFLAVSGLG